MSLLTPQAGASQIVENNAADAQIRCSFIMESPSKKFDAMSIPQVGRSDSGYWRRSRIVKMARSTGQIRERRTTAHAQARKSWGHGAKAASPQKLLLINEVPAPVLLPARFVTLRAERLFLAVANRLDAACIYAGRNQSTLHRAGAFVAQCDVVLRGTALIAMSFDS